MKQYIDKNRIEEILRNLWKKDDGHNPEHRICYNKALQEVQCELDTLEVKEINSTDAFIEKAYEFFDEHLWEYINVKANCDTFINIDVDKFKDDFKNYIKKDK